MFHNFIESFFTNICANIEKNAFIFQGINFSFSLFFLLVIGVSVCLSPSSKLRTLLSDLREIRDRSIVIGTRPCSAGAHLRERRNDENRVEAPSPSVVSDLYRLSSIPLLYANQERRCGAAPWNLFSRQRRNNRGLWHARNHICRAHVLSSACHLLEETGKGSKCLFFNLLDEFFIISGICEAYSRTEQI